MVNGKQTNRAEFATFELLLHDTVTKGKLKKRGFVLPDSYRGGVHSSKEKICRQQEQEAEGSCLYPKHRAE